MYRQDLDALKGISIIAVVLFHIGILKSGYLGVDAFFVINGFLVVPSVVKRIVSNEFSFINFIKKRLIRLLPLIVLASMVSLSLGYFLMLPDHYENLAQSVIASNLMSENILSAITTKNYWDVVNEYKPLMHLWYVGILFEFYVTLPFLLIGAKKIAVLRNKSVDNAIFGTLLFVSLVSSVLYLLPSISSGNRFYYIPYRFFELGIGGLVALNVNRVKSFNTLYVKKLAVLFLLGIMCCSIYNLLIGDFSDSNVVIGKDFGSDNGMPFSSQFVLLATVILTSIVVVCKDGESWLLNSNLLSCLGKMSYSIFIWHQILLAFYRYSFSNNMSLCFSILFIFVVLGVSSLSYYFIEKKIYFSEKSFIGWSLAACLVMVTSGYLVIHAGVVRDVPELDVVKGKEHRGMFGEFCDRVYQYKQYPIEENGKPNVLVEGISFGRDFANVIIESEYIDSVNLVYVYNWKDPDLIEKVSKSDYIFCFSAKSKVPDSVWENKKANCIVKGISTKNFGECNGIVYKNRYSDSYFNCTAEIEPGYKELNEEWKKQWGKDYIDLLTPSLVDENRVRVFTDDKRYISQDCRHLTQAGAQWYANTLDWKEIFNK